MLLLRTMESCQEFLLLLLTLKLSEVFFICFWNVNIQFIFQTRVYQQSVAQVEVSVAEAVQLLVALLKLFFGECFGIHSDQRLLCIQRIRRAINLLLLGIFIVLLFIGFLRMNHTVLLMVFPRLATVILTLGTTIQVLLPALQLLLSLSLQLFFFLFTCHIHLDFSFTLLFFKDEVELQVVLHTNQIHILFRRPHMIKVKFATCKWICKEWCSRWHPRRIMLLHLSIIASFMH